MLKTRERETRGLENLLTMKEIFNDNIDFYCLIFEREEIEFLYQYDEITKEMILLKSIWLVEYHY